MLVIFMVTAPMMQRGLEVSLPESRRAEAISAERIFVTVPLTFRSDGRIQVGEDAIALEVLHERMAQDLAGRADRNVFLRGDGGITYQELMSVIDKLKEGGVEEVGLVTDVPSSR